MKERLLYAPVRDWLRSKGWAVRVEIFDADVVAEREGKLLVVELKTGFTGSLINQLHDRARWSDFVYAAIPSTTYKPRKHAMAYWGFGVLTVDGDRVRERLRPRPQPWMRNKMHAYRLKKLLEIPSAQDHECAGLPACKELAEMRRISRSLAGIEGGQGK